MAQQQNQGNPSIGFGSIQILKTQTLGIGSYGKVSKAKCDDLVCAAKIIHETLFDPTAQKQIARHREHRLPFRRFQQECEFMSAIRHPNIVQYLGTHQDPETGLPVLLMELMDDSLTHFLESSLDPVPYHTQVNFCHDITLAISYLHSNGIIHRDLSSNNVLLRGNVIAKVTDFGMAKLGDANPRATRISLTMAPGTDAYMPPEAVKNPPVYTAKIDCFAIGTLIIQILTRQFPDPGERLKSIQINHTQFPGGIVHVNIPEIERRQNHISQVDPNHPLLPIALHCLKDSDAERPSAQELCHRVEALKEKPQYTESVRSAQERRPEQDITTETEREKQIKELQQQIQQKDGVIQEKEQTISAQQQECQKLREAMRDKDKLILERERQLQHISEKVTVQFQTRIEELEQQLVRTKPPSSPLFSMPHSRKLKTSPKLPRKSLPSLTVPPPSYFFPYSQVDIGKLTWTKGKTTFSKMQRGPDAVVDGDMVYLTTSNPYQIVKFHSYNWTNQTYRQLPECPTRWCSLAVVDNFLTAIGGKSGGSVTNQLFSLTGKDSHETEKWEEKFPPMPTKRSQSTAVCTGQALIVAGGIDHNRKKIAKVEVMDIATQQWSTAADLPEPLYSASATICGDQIYMLGGWNDNDKLSNLVYKCSLADLFQSCQTKIPRSLRKRLTQSLSSLTDSDSIFSVWNKVADLPVTGSTCVTLHGRLLVIGGQNSNREPTPNIRTYNAAFNRWEIISKMTVARRLCFAAVLPNNKLMIAGGCTGQSWNSETDSVETATAEIL